MAAVTACRNKLGYNGTFQDEHYVIFSENWGTMELVRIRIMRYFQKIGVQYGTCQDTSYVIFSEKWGTMEPVALCDIFRKLGYTGTCQDTRYAIFSENWGTMELVRLHVTRHFQKIGVRWNLSGYAICDIFRKSVHRSLFFL